MDWIQSTVEATVRFVISALTKDLATAVLALLSTLLQTPMGLLSDLDLIELVNYARMLAWIILPLVLIRQGITVAQNRAEGAATETGRSGACQPCER